MEEVRIEKVTLNIGVGEAGDKLEKAAKLLNAITNKKVVQTKTMKRIPTWSLRPKLAIGCKVTLRGKDAEALLIRLLKAIDNNLKERSFDKTGNFSFGVPEYIDIPDVPYNPKIGIIGLDVAVTLEKPGYRIKKRKVMKGKIKTRHLVKKEQAIEFVKKKFNVNIIGEE